MKPLKISVFSATILFLFGLALPAYAVPIYEESEYPVYATYDETEFKFAIELKSSSEYLARAWFFEIELNEGALIKSKIKAGETVEVKEKIKYDKKTGAVTSRTVDINIDPLLFEGKFSSFGIVQDEENNDQLNFLGTFEYSMIAESEVELFYIYGNFVPIENEVFQTFTASISNFDPTQPADPSNPVPEPSSVLLIGAGMVCIAAVRRRRKA